MINLRALTLKELEEFVKAKGWKPYRARQIFRWVWHRGVLDFKDMTDIALSARELLAEEAFLPQLKVRSRVQSCDGAVKYVFELVDGEYVESVFIPEDNRVTVCVSTQVGCRMGCRFCATGRIPWKRNLEGWEIAGQVMEISKMEAVRVSNVVFMGMGEPLDNTEEVIKAVDFLNADLGMRIGARKLTISTVGIVPGIYRLGEDPRQLKLALSLNFPDENQRREFMPITMAHPLKEVLSALKWYVEKKGRRITLEYVLFKGINDTKMSAQKLSKIAGSVPSKINIIPYNPFPGSPFSAPSRKEVEQFAGWLYDNCPAVTIRWSRGGDVKAACGQLGLGLYKEEALCGM